MVTDLLSLMPQSRDAIASEQTLNTFKNPNIKFSFSLILYFLQLSILGNCEYNG